MPSRARDRSRGRMGAPDKNDEIRCMSLGRSRSGCFILINRPCHSAALTRHSNLVSCARASLAAGPASADKRKQKKPRLRPDGQERERETERRGEGGHQPNPPPVVSPLQRLKSLNNPPSMTEFWPLRLAKGCSSISHTNPGNMEGGKPQSSAPQHRRHKWLSCGECIARRSAGDRTRW